MDVREEYRAKLRTPEQAVELVKSGDWVDYSSNICFPALLDALRRRGYNESTLEGIAGLNLWYLLKRAEREARIK